MPERAHGGAAARRRPNGSEAWPSGIGPANVGRGRRRAGSWCARAASPVSAHVHAAVDRHRRVVLQRLRRRAPRSSPGRWRSGRRRRTRGRSGRPAGRPAGRSSPAIQCAIACSTAPVLSYQRGGPAVHPLLLARARAGAARRPASRRRAGGTGTTRGGGPGGRGTGSGARSRPAGPPSRWCSRTASHSPAGQLPEHRGAQQEPHRLRRLAGQQLVPEEVDDVRVGPADLRRRRRPVDAVPHRHRRQVDPGRPALGPLDQPRARSASAASTPARARTSPASAASKARSAGPNSAHRRSARSRPSCQRRPAPARHRQLRAGRQAGRQLDQQVRHRRAVKVMDVVQDDEDRPVPLADSPHQQRHGQAVRRAALERAGTGPHEAVQRVSDVVEHPPGVVVGFVHRHPGDVPAVLLGPLCQRGGLAVARRRDQEDQRLLGRPGQAPAGASPRRTRPGRLTGAMIFGSTGVTVTVTPSCPEGSRASGLAPRGPPTPLSPGRRRDADAERSGVRAHPTLARLAAQPEPVEPTECTAVGVTRSIRR